jgi:hypothetical protein
VALVGGRFSNGKADGPAIENLSVLYARDVEAAGFAKVIESNSGREAIGITRVDEYHSHATKKLFDSAKDESLALEIQPTPEIAWDNDPSHWYCLDDAGATASDNQDDSDAIENGIQAAARLGKTTVYFRGCGGREPNWFNLRRAIVVPAPIRRVIGLGWARVLRDSDDAGFVVDDRSAAAVHFQNIDSFGGPPIVLENRSQKRTMVVESCGVKILGTGRGDIFVSDCPALLELRVSGQRCWARQLNPEGTTDTGLVTNLGGKLWCLGVKHEGRGVRFATRNGGSTEVLGLFNYGGSPEEMDMRPSFIVEESAFSVAGLREIAFDSHTAYNKVQETAAGEVRTLDKQNEGGWIGWSLYRSRR